MIPNKNKHDFIQYVKTCLIPALENSGLNTVADDWKTALHWLTQPDADSKSKDQNSPIVLLAADTGFSTKEISKILLGENENEPINRHGMDKQIGT